LIIGSFPDVSRPGEAIPAGPLEASNDGASSHRETWSAFIGRGSNFVG
jgi:hypothetical protein